MRMAGRRLNLHPTGYSSALYVTYSAAAAVVAALWRYISVMPLPLTHPQIKHHKVVQKVKNCHIINVSVLQQYSALKVHSIC